MHIATNFFRDAASLIVLGGVGIGIAGAAVGSVSFLIVAATVAVFAASFKVALRPVPAQEFANGDARLNDFAKEPVPAHVS